MTDWKLRPHPTFAGVEGPVLVVVMDGVGCGRDDEGNAVWLARTPTLDWLSEHALYTTLAAHGVSVGLPSDDDMGNSEVGHNALGAGRVFDQGAKFLSAFASVLEPKDEGAIDKLLDQIPDPAGTFYRFSLPTSLLRRRKGGVTV